MHDLPAGGAAAPTLALQPCRSCGAALRELVVDLGLQPLCQAHVEADQLARPELFRPLAAFVCGACFLVQLGHHVDPREVFTDAYGYFSSFSETWLAHAERYVELVTRRLELGPASRVVEVASNDGYLLQHFVRRGVPVLGVEPCANVARAARERGVPTDGRFFGAEVGRDLAASGGPADLIIGNNVMAHVPAPHDFVAGLAALLAPRGTITLEFPHLQRLLEHREFDTIYHEHVSYLSLDALRRLAEPHGLEPYDVEELPTHGGSLRVYLRHASSGAPPARPAVAELLRREDEAGLRDLATYRTFEAGARRAKRDLLAFLIGVKERGETIVGYGAPGKGNTLLNYCGVRGDFLDYTVDRSPHKQGRFLPGPASPSTTRIGSRRPAPTGC
jgi:SAM-dependent methyltransferase